MCTEAKERRLPGREFGWLWQGEPVGESELRVLGAVLGLKSFKDSPDCPVNTVF